MKYLTLLFCLLIAANLHAQQPKAYETVRYTAKMSKLHFKLDYADGYPAASQIKLGQPHKKVQIFMPESGVLGPDGCLIFRSDTEASIQLFAINPETTAPTLIKGTYRYKNKVLRLMFRKTK